MRWTMCGSIYGMLLAVAWLPRVASAQPIKYSAFDLIGDKLMVSLPSGTTAPAGTLSTFNCKLTTGTSLVIERTPELPCNAIFAAADPQDLMFDLVNGGVRSTAALELERGLPSLQLGEYDAESRRLVLGSANINGKVAVFLTPQERWQELDVQGGKATVPPSSELARNATVYFRTAAGRPIFKVVWRFIDKPAKPVAAPKIFDDVCTQDVRTKRATENGAAWEILLDGGHRRLDVVRLVRTVDPNTWGIVFVSQPANGDVVLAVDGTVEIANPGIKGGSATSGSEKQTSPPPPASDEPPICSWHLVAPRKPGPFKVTAKLLDTSDRSTTLGERQIEVIVQERFAGAFRIGVAGILGAEDRKFEARTAPGSTQPEIVRTSHTPFELVVGYTLFFDGGKGRRYLLRDDSDNWFTSNFGLFLGFGAVSATTSDLDFLKSLHVGLEYEITPNIAVGLTVVGRRLDQLSAGARVGGPAPSSIPIEQGYDVGAGLVVNLLPGFFKFAKGAK